MGHYFDYMNNLVIIFEDGMEWSNVREEVDLFRNALIDRQF